jgi:hypothetical protein
VAETFVRPEIVARARAFNKIILPTEFFDDNDNLSMAAKSVVEGVVGKVRDSQAWLFVSADTALGLEQNRELRRQILLAQTLIKEFGISADRIFVKGFPSGSPVKDGIVDLPGEVSIYIAMQ